MTAELEQADKVERRRAAIIRLLETRNDHLPLPARHTATSSGFVNEPRPRTCPDCLANGRVLKGCETCGGSGTVAPAAIDRIAVADELPDDGDTRDPYATNTIQPIGFDVSRHDAGRERDRQIDRLTDQLRPPRPESELLAEANRRGYAWEEARRDMYQDFDYAVVDRALDELRTHDPDAAHALNAVYVDGWLTEVGIITPAVEQHCDRGLRFLDQRLAAFEAIANRPIRAPGQPEHPAAARQRARRNAA